MNRPTLIRGALLVVLAALVLVPFGCFVWPTAYRYDHMNMKGTVLPVRIHRLNGRTEILFPDGWRLADSQGSASDSLPADALSRIEVKYNMTNYGYLEAEVQNGSDWTLRRLTVNVTVTDGSGAIVFRDRQFILTGCNGTGAPGTNSRFFEDVNLKLKPGQRFAASLVGAGGTK